MAADPEELSFEQAVARLEEIVLALEQGSVTLDECLAGFQEALVLSRRCEALLESAGRQLSVLTGEAGPEPAEGLDWA